MNEIVFGDCRSSMIDMIGRGDRVQMCVTSPPYFGLRSYLPDAVRIKKRLPDAVRMALLRN